MLLPFEIRCKDCGDRSVGRAKTRERAIEGAQAHRLSYAAIFNEVHHPYVKEVTLKTARA